MAFSSAATCASLRIRPSCAILASSAFSRFLVFSRSWRCHTQRTPKGETDRPRFFNSFDTRTWPQVGCSSAIATTAASISGATRFFTIGLRRLISASANSPPFSYSSLKR